ncbi:MAG TPA: glycosyl hydrolase family 18 protein [Flavilitoribacter sp.]|nr:glycosyl hydrolase family 18 protein [Flavilitoribacter sp.]
MRKALILWIMLAGWMQSGKLQAQNTSDGQAEKKQSRIEVVWQSLFKPDRDTAVRPAFPTEKGIKDKLGLIYNAIHSEEFERYSAVQDSQVQDWLDYFRLEDKQVLYQSPKGDTLVIANNVKVFGWHPFWMGEAYKSYNYQLLNYVSLFSYNLNTAAEPNIAYDNPEVVEGWSNPNFKLIGMAHEKGCKVLITLTSFYKSGNRQFLDNKSRQQERLIQNLSELLVKLQADGLDVNFEQIPAGYELKFSQFIRKLRTSLPPHPAGGNYIVSVVLPKLNQYQIYQVDTLQKYVDFFILTGYDYHIGAKMPPGPVAPLFKSEGSIEQSVFHWLEQGVNRRKLLLGLPYYGALWSTTNANDPNWRDTSKITFQHIPYWRIRQQYGNRREPPNYNIESWTANYTYTVTDSIGNTVRRETLYFDDSTTLNAKFNWVLKEGLGGVGIWALGYDSGRKELWSLIDTLFAPSQDTIAVYHPAQERFYLPQSLSKYRDVVAVGSVFLVVFLLAGFVGALFDAAVRDVFFANKTLRLTYIMGGFLFIAVAAVLYYYLKVSEDPYASPYTPEQLLARNRLVVLAVGIISGILITVLGTALFERRRKRLP